MRGSAGQDVGGGDADAVRGSNLDLRLAGGTGSGVLVGQLAPA